MSDASPQLGEVISALSGRGLAEVEVYQKWGRCRRVQHSVDGEMTTFGEEQGWAVRAGDSRRSFLYAATGLARPDAPWPEADGAALRLPDAAPRIPWSPPSDVDSPLLGESEAHSLLHGLARTLEEEADEVTGLRLLNVVLEDGSSEVEILSSRNVRARYRNRAASLYVEAAVSGERETTTASIQLAARQARTFNPLQVARRLADYLVISQRGRAPRRDRGEILISPEVASRLLSGLVPFLIGTQSEERLAAMRDRRGRVASPAVTIIDDGRLKGGLLEAPVDGEGVTTGPTVLLEDGILRQPLLAWWEQRPQGSRLHGCRLRAGWRGLPRTGPTHLYLKPQPGTSVSSLLLDLARGYYFADTTGPPRFDLDADRFSLPVLGFGVRRGRPQAAVAGAWLCGGVRALLQGVQATARDLTFFPCDGIVGSPSLLLTGVEVREAP